MKFVLPIVGLHIVLAVMLGVTLNIWADESCSLETTQQDCMHAIHQSLYFEWQPPGYFITLWIWRQFNPSSILWARLLSATFTALSIVLFFHLSLRLARERSSWPYWATIVFAFHPYTIFAASEVRLYAMGLLLSLLQFDLFWRGYIEAGKHWRWFYWILAAASLYVNVLLGLTLAAQNAMLWVNGRWKDARHHFGGLVMSSLIFLPMFVLHLRHLEDKDIPGLHRNIAKSFSFALGSVAYNIGPLPRLETTLVLRTGLAIALLIFGFWLIYRHRSKITDRQWMVWFYLAAVSVLLSLFLVVTNLPSHPRYTYPLLVASVLAWGKVTELIERPAIIGAVWSASIVLGMGTVIYTFSPLCKTGDWKRVTLFLESNEQANQPIIVFISEVDTILNHYYRGQNMVIPIPTPQRMDRYFYVDFDIPSEAFIQEKLDRLLLNANECWLVTNEAAILNAPHQYHVEHLQAYLQRNFSVQASVDFVDSKVCHMKRKQALVAPEGGRTK